MGGSASRCCDVSIVEKKNAASRPSQAGRTIDNRRGVQTYESFKVAYKQKAVLKKDSKVIVVIANDTGGHYVCRKLRLDAAPCATEMGRGKHYQALAGIEHPHICKFVDAFEDKEYMYLIYEKADPTRLFDYVRTRKSLTEAEAAEYVRQITAALYVMHKSNIVHGRLYPRSLILVPGFQDEDPSCEVQIKVCDIGQGFVLRPAAMEESDESVGRTNELERYALTPEQAHRELPPTEDGCAPKGAEHVDMWALGVIVYHMLSGSTPFGNLRRDELVDALQTSLVSFQSEMWKKLSPDAQDAVSSLLMVNPLLRLTAQNLLRHPWIKVAKVSFPKRRMRRLLNNLKSNVEESEFKKFVLRVIAEHLPPEGKQAVVVEQAFRCLDKNGDGVLSVSEIVTGLQKHMDMSSDELSRLFAQVDRDGSGTLNVQEFVSVTLDQQQLCSMPLLWQVFNAFDKDQGGLITHDEIESIVKEVEGVLLSKEQVQSLTDEIRQELEMVAPKGCIDFDQFVYVLLNSKPNPQEAIKKDCARLLWNSCGVDCHEVRKLPITWSLDKPKNFNFVSPRSVYRKKDPLRREASRAAPAG